MTRNKPYIVGLTGGIACGKSSVTSALRQAGAFVVDADEISHALTAPGGIALPMLRQRFGDGVFRGAELDRQALASLVFGDAAALNDLNAIMHPMVFEEMEHAIRENAYAPAVVLDIPLLYETGYDRKCGEVWSVWAPRRAQVDRLLCRGMTAEEAEKRIGSQMPALEKARRAAHVIVTTGPKAETALLARRLWDDLLRRLPND